MLKSERASMPQKPVSKDAAALPSNAETAGSGLRHHVRRRIRRDARALGGLMCSYAALAYFIMPFWWRHHERENAAREAPKITRTAAHIPGDPINVALVGTEEEVIKSMLDAGWRPADPKTFKTSLRIARSVLFGRTYAEAPVSNLYLFGRRQDLAFEQQVGNTAKQRHHVRFWRSDQPDEQERPLWLGAATFDRSVGFSHRTGQITHHIDADLDKERDKLLRDLKKSGQVIEEYPILGIGPTLRGRNGGGDRYFTDGFVGVGVLMQRF